MARAGRPRTRVRRGAFRFSVLCALLAGMAACTRGESEPIELPEPMPGQPQFEYPQEAWELEVEGETTLMVHVTDRGGVDSVYVLETSGYSVLDSAAARGARRLRFSPARQGERRVAAWARLPVIFNKDMTPSVGLSAPDSAGGDD